MKNFREFLAALFFLSLFFWPQTLTVVGTLGVSAAIVFSFCGVELPWLLMTSGILMVVGGLSLEAELGR